MNRETLTVFNYIVNNPQWVNKIKKKREDNSNYKDFYNQAGYVIMELLTTEDKFLDYPRNEVNIKKIVDMYF